MHPLPALTSSVKMLQNLFMAVYSFYAFWGTALVFWRNWKRAGFDPLVPFCDPKRVMDVDMDYWLYTFYISKYIGAVPYSAFATVGNHSQPSFCRVHRYHFAPVARQACFPSREQPVFPPRYALNLFLWSMLFRLIWALSSFPPLCDCLDCLDHLALWFLRRMDWSSVERGTLPREDHLPCVPLFSLFCS